MSFDSYRNFVMHFEKRHFNIEQKKILQHECFHGNSNGTPSHSESNSYNRQTLINVYREIIGIRVGSIFINFVDLFKDEIKSKRNHMHQY